MEDGGDERHHQRNPGQRACTLLDIRLIAEVAQQEAKDAAGNPIPNF